MDLTYLSPLSRDWRYKNVCHDAPSLLLVGLGTFVSSVDSTNASGHLWCEWSPLTSIATHFTPAIHLTWGWQRFSAQSQTVNILDRRLSRLSLEYQRSHRQYTFVSQETLLTLKCEFYAVFMSCETLFLDVFQSLENMKTTLSSWAMQK